MVNKNDDSWLSLNKNDVMHHKIRTGQCGEALARAMMIKYGVPLVHEAQEACKYDLIIDWNNKLYRVQVKSTNIVWRHRSRLYYRWKLTNHTPKKQLQSEEWVSSNTMYNSEQVDIFALACIPLDKVIFYPYSPIKSKAIQIKDVQNTNAQDTLYNTLNELEKRE
tara:strand:+ start:595 stop:1089 length:495 start_codon:yes stop_codon:yes gene_type:complete